MRLPFSVLGQVERLESEVQHLGTGGEHPRSKAHQGDSDDDETVNGGDDESSDDDCRKRPTYIHSSSKFEKVFEDNEAEQPAAKRGPKPKSLKEKEIKRKEKEVGCDEAESLSFHMISV